MGKDKLMQGCMRMRGLFDGQSVMFVGADDVNVQLESLANGGKPTIQNVLELVMQNTVQETEEGLTMWAEMGAIYATTCNNRDIAQLAENIELGSMYMSGRDINTAHAAIVRTLNKYAARLPVSRELDAQGKTLLLRIEARADEYARDLVRCVKALDQECEREMEKEEEEEAQQEQQIPRSVPRAHREWDCSLLFAAKGVADLAGRVQVLFFACVCACVCGSIFACILLSLVF
jgi:hypothetical protein